MRTASIVQKFVSINGIKWNPIMGILMAWEYLVVELKNMGRTMFENGVMVKSHTKKSDLSKLPQSSWNQKGKAMMMEAKGSFLNDYGAEDWELVNVNINHELDESTYVFKREKK